EPVSTSLENALVHRRIWRWALPQIITEMGPGILRAPFPIAVDLGRLVLALGSVALFLGHRREALTLAGVQALAGMVAALAGALALAGVGADAVAFAGRIGRRRHGGAGQEQSGRSGGNRGT